MNEIKNDKTLVGTICPMCKQRSTIEVVTVDLEEYLSNSGRYIQDIFHYLTDDERERIQSGMCNDCFNSLFEQDRYPE
jgi:hypothetical protein